MGMAEVLGVTVISVIVIMFGIAIFEQSHRLNRPSAGNDANEAARLAGYAAGYQDAVKDEAKRKEKFENRSRAQIERHKRKKTGRNRSAGALAYWASPEGKARRAQMSIRNKGRKLGT